jgi:hypothetical protein
VKFDDKALFSDMIRLLLFCCLVGLGACRSTRLLPLTKGDPSVGGAVFYQQASAMGWAARDSFILQQLKAANIPSFLRKMVPVRVTIPSEHKPVVVTFFVSPDYLSIGSDQDWARVSLTAKGAVKALSMLDCFAPTPRLADLIYRQAKVKLAPVPLFAHRDSTPVMWHHHLIIEGQRKQRQGLIAGIKKDIVFVNAKGDSVMDNRVGIYGWHKTDGVPIQPFYQGHVWWYADYSHGLRLVSRQVKVGRKWTRIEALLRDTSLRASLF